MKKRKGFTLVELLSAIACLSIVLAGVSGVLVYVLRSVGADTEASRRLAQVQTLRQQVEALEQPETGGFAVTETGEVMYDSRMLSTIEGLRTVDVEPRNGMVYCTLTFVDGDSYCFIIGKDRAS